VGGRALDLNGRTFGKLTVVERSHKTKDGSWLWRCRCECGNEHLAAASKLSRGPTKSCGCDRGGKLNVAGMVYGKLTAIETSHLNSQGKWVWRCICECGKGHLVAARDLVSGNTKSCGCGRQSGWVELTGRVSGKLTAVERSHVDTKGNWLWRCVCSCGEERLVEASSIKSGKVTSCGCGSQGRRRSRQDLTGQVFGNWVVVRTGRRSSHKDATWWCLCKCGVYKLVDHKSLVKGMSKSCGCSRGGRTYNGYIKHDTPYKAAVAGILNNYKRSVRERDRVFELTNEEFEALLCSPCTYCGEEPDKDQCSFGGIDRVDNEVGYVVSNCVPCCTMCNRMKYTYSVVEFLEQAKRIAAQAL
jgi:hypothetical protein